jgi:hypothetical protein
LQALLFQLIVLFLAIHQVALRKIASIWNKIALQ